MAAISFWDGENFIYPEKAPTKEEADPRKGPTTLDEATERYMSVSSRLTFDPLAQDKKRQIEQEKKEKSSFQRFRDKHSSLNDDTSSFDVLLNTSVPISAPFTFAKKRKKDKSMSSKDDAKRADCKENFEKDQCKQEVPASKIIDSKQQKSTFALVVFKKKKKKSFHSCFSGLLISKGLRLTFFFPT